MNEVVAPNLEDVSQRAHVMRPDVTAVSQKYAAGMKARFDNTDKKKTRS